LPDEYDNDNLVKDSPPPEDGYVKQAKDDLISHIDSDHEAVFYERQLQLFYEKDYFHWVTARALEELAESGDIRSEHLTLRRPLMTEAGRVETSVQMRFFFWKNARSWRRKAKKLAALVEAYSEPALTRAVGRQAENLFDAALPRAGFMPIARNVREYNGRRWERTNHNLDRIYTRDNIAYGIEIKNQLGYMEREQFTTKLEMCEFLGVTPVFIARMMPKEWIYQVQSRPWRGFCLIFKWWLFPLGQEPLVKTLQQTLGLPVDSPMEIQDGTIERFLKWHRWRWRLQEPTNSI
jgi:hypothetical protein